MEKQGNSSTKSKEAHRLLKILHPEVKRNFEILHKIGSGYLKKYNLFKVNGNNYFCKTLDCNMFITSDLTKIMY